MFNSTVYLSPCLTMPLHSPFRFCAVAHVSSPCLLTDEHVPQVLDGNLSPKEAVFEIMNLPQIEER